MQLDSVKNDNRKLPWRVGKQQVCVKNFQIVNHNTKLSTIFCVKVSQFLSHLKLSLDIYRKDHEQLFQR